VYLIGEFVGGALAAGVFTFWAHEKKVEAQNPLLTGFVPSAYTDDKSQLLEGTLNRRYEFN
jgi:hypothetical protein